MVDLENYKVSRLEHKAKADEVVNYYGDIITDPDGGTNQTVFFDSLFHLTECVNRNTAKKEGGNGSWGNNGYSFDDQEDDWTFGNYFPDLASTKTALEDGSVPDKIMERVDKSKIALYDRFPELFELERHAIQMKRRRTYDESGDELNIDRYMSGDPAMWQKMSRSPKKQSMKIMINAGMNAGNNPDKFIDNMVLVASFIDIVESAGITTELWYAPVSSGTTSELKVASTMCKIKGTGEPVDLSRLLSTGAAGLFRWYYFRAWCNIYKGTPSWGLGQSNGKTPEWLKQMYNFDVCLESQDTDSDMVKVFTDTIKDLY